MMRCRAALEGLDDIHATAATRARVGRLVGCRGTIGRLRLGFETLPGEHPVVPLMLRDTGRTKAMVAHLYRNCILATGLNYPVVPKGDEEIRFQISADHTSADIDAALEALASFNG
jgi:glycine C-acetyltransferase